MWGLLQRLEHAGIQSQCFHTESRFADADAVSGITGRAYRHIDPRLMSLDVCREALMHGAQGADIAIVEDASVDHGKDIEQLCRWLDLPRLAVVDVTDFDPCRMPARPERLDGVFITGAANCESFARHRLRWETLWDVLVLGGLIGCAHIHAILQRLPAGARPSGDIVRALGESLYLVDNVDMLLEISSPHTWTSMAGEVFQHSTALQGMKIAVAFDDAFHKYFADTLDLLELNGATLRDFSPLTDADLPPDTDVVYLGGGQVERFAESLSSNACMIAALRRHARHGQRIYAEEGAAAYLCNRIQFDSGECAPMCGILPAVAHYNAQLARPELVDIRLTQSCWWGERDDRLRGYRSGQWQLSPMIPSSLLAKQEPVANHEGANRRGPNCDLIYCDNVIASQVHLNLVAQPHLLNRFASAAVNPAVR